MPATPDRHDTAQDASRGLAVVAGATGYLGRHVARALHDDGWSVRSLSRRPLPADDPLHACGEVFLAEATRAGTLGALFDGARVAFSSVGVRHFRRHPTYEEVDYGANLNLVEAAERAGVQRFVFVSVLAGQQVRRLSPLVDARERIVDRLAGSSMRAVTLRPTAFFNDMSEIFDMARRGRAWLIGDGETRINPIHGADLAAVAGAALRDVDPAPEIAAGGPETFTQQEIAELAFHVLGRPPHVGHLPPWTLRALAALMRPFSANASALARMFAFLGERDAVAPAFGTHRLEDHFAELAQGA